MGKDERAQNPYAFDKKNNVIIKLIELLYERNFLMNEGKYICGIWSWIQCEIFEFSQKE